MTHTQPVVPILFPDRAAADLLGGVLYQLLWSALRWLELSADEFLLVEGDEDIVKVLVDADGNIVELTEDQIKRLTGSVTARSPAVHETLFGFLCSFHFHAAAGRKCAFVFTSTAAQGRQEVENAGSPKEYKATLHTDVLATWQHLTSIGESASAVLELASDIRQLVDGYADQGAARHKGRTTSITRERLQAATTHLDATALWSQFFKSVTWRLEQDNAGALLQTLVDQLASDSRLNGLPAALVAIRLIHHLLIVGAKAEVEERMVSRQDLAALLATTEESLSVWGARRHSERIGEWIERASRVEKRIDALEAQVARLSLPTEEAAAELVDAYRTRVIRDTSKLRALGIGRPIDLAAAWRLQARMGGASFDASLLLEATDQRFLIVGKAGAGKSTFLQQLAHRAASSASTPIRIRLPALAEFLQDMPIGTALSRHVAESCGLSVQEAHGIVRSAGIFFCDGLDACGSDAGPILDALTSYSEGRDGLRICIATRSDFVAGLPSNFAVVELLPLDKSKVPSALEGVLRAVGESEEAIGAALSRAEVVQGAASLELTSLNIVLMLHLARNHTISRLSRASLFTAALESLRERPEVSKTRSLDDRLHAGKVLNAAAWLLCESPKLSRLELIQGVLAATGDRTHEVVRVDFALTLWERAAVVHRSIVRDVERIEFLHDMVRDFAAAQHIVNLPDTRRAKWFSDNAARFPVVASFVAELGGAAVFNELLDASDDDDIEAAELAAAALLVCPEVDTSALERVAKRIGAAVASPRPVVVQRVSQAALPVVARFPQLLVRACRSALDGPAEWNVLAAIRLLVALPSIYVPTDRVLEYLEARATGAVSNYEGGVDTIWPMWNDILVPALEVLVGSGRTPRIDKLIETFVLKDTGISVGAGMDIAMRLRAWGYDELYEQRTKRWAERFGASYSWDRKAWEGDTAFLTLLEQTFANVEPGNCVEPSLPNLGRLIGALGYLQAAAAEWSPHFLSATGDGGGEVMRGVACAAGIDPSAIVAEAREARQRFVPENFANGSSRTTLLTFVVDSPNPVSWARTTGLNLSLDALFELLRSRSMVLAVAACQLIVHHGDRQSVRAKARAALESPKNDAATLLAAVAEELFGTEASEVLCEALRSGLTDQNAPFLVAWAEIDPHNTRLRELVVEMLQTAMSSRFLAAVRAAAVINSLPLQELQRAFERCANAPQPYGRRIFYGTHPLWGDGGGELFKLLRQQNAFTFGGLAILLEAGEFRSEAAKALASMAASSGELFEQLEDGLRSGRFAFDLLHEVLELSAGELTPRSERLLGFHDHEHEEVRALMMHSLATADWLPRQEADAVLRQHTADPSALVRTAADRGLQHDKETTLARISRKSQLQRVRMR